ncbi:methyl-accepting chemotaxis protein [Aquitalea sp. LB_tupeE]|uniref:methyl-accepting chemotaxis protein n=1 Tax=Aquitalea sp. LB_tupeE TaxID=2748078 RepID=UPI0015BC846B|nr:methyl-accepting chemotaxis protein [Aquitalea sp. LB_tupeE]NWK78210.1 methyl-accepting chemotaxis protein [Aquitalea sp. LB_tupeE]
MKSLRSKLIVFNALLMAVFGLVLVLIVFIQMRGEILNGLNHEFDSALKGQGSVVKTWLDEKKQEITAQAEVATQADALRFLKVGARAGFNVNYAGFADGRSVFSDDWQAPADYKVTTRDWYQQALAAGKPVVTEPYVDEASKKLTITVAAPILQGGKPVGVAGGDVFVDSLVQSVLSLKVRGNGYAFITDGKGTILAHPQAGLTLKPISTLAPTLNAARLTELANSQGLQQVELDGQDMLLSIQHIPGSDWLIGLATHRADILAPLNTLLLTVAGLSALIFVLLIPLAGVLLGRMLGGLVALQQAMQDIAHGEGDLTLRLKISGQDEIAATATAFNQFVEQLGRLFRGLRDDAGGVVVGVSQVSGQVGEVAERARGISDMSSSSAATLEQITVSIAQIADHAREAAVLATRTGQGLDAGANGMQQLASGMESTGQSVCALEGMLAALEQRSQQISGITEVIRDIADQTNLLALNAAIEAARAGEQGRGFAVVADEVRKLAERTAQATVEIAGMVSAIRTETGKAVDDVQRTVHVVNDGVQLTRDAVANIQSIRHSMQDVVSKMSEISHSTQEQHNASTLIAQSSEQINSRVLENDDMLQQASQTLQGLADKAGQMNGQFAKFHL